MASTSLIPSDQGMLPGFCTAPMMLIFLELYCLTTRVTCGWTRIFFSTSWLLMSSSICCGSSPGHLQTVDVREVHRPVRLDAKLLRHVVLLAEEGYLEDVAGPDDGARGRSRQVRRPGWGRRTGDEAAA